MLLLLFFGLLASKTQDVVESHYKVEYSLAQPHVADNGRNAYYAMDGEYTVVTHSSNSFVQLGYRSPNTSGILQMKTPIKKKAFKLEINFECISNTDNAFGFWISSPLSSGNYYGRNVDFSGVGIVVNNNSKLSMQVINKTGVQTKSSKLFYPKLQPSNNKLIIEYISGILTVKLSNFKDNILLYNEKVHLNNTMVFGISNSNGKSIHPLIIRNISGYLLTKLPPKFVKGSGKSNSNLIVFFGICTILGLVYYLYSKQSTKLRNN